jgi:transposase-like protein
MSILSHLHQLFDVHACYAYIHQLRWKERPLQCPRYQSHDVDPWGNYHYRPGCKRYWCNGCERTFNDLTNTMMHQSKRSLPHWILATFLLCLSCSSRRIAREVGVHIRTLHSMAEQQKLYAYVDESGQDTRGTIFLVSVVVTGEQRDAARRALQGIEWASGKRERKWTRSRVRERAAYIEQHRSLGRSITPTTVTPVPMSISSFSLPPKRCTHGSWIDQPQPFLLTDWSMQSAGALRRGYAN